MVLRKLIISEATKMATKYFLRHKLLFQYDPISGNLGRISSIRLKPERKTNRATNIK
jgi:hypothetical protein